MLLDQTHPRASHSDIVMYMVNLSRLRQDIVVVEKGQIDCRFADYIDHKMMQVVAGSGTAADRWVPTSHYLSSSHRRSYRQRYIHDHYGLPSWVFGVETVYIFRWRLMLTLESNHVVMDEEAS